MAKNVSIGILLNPAGFKQGAQSVKRELTGIRTTMQNTASNIGKGFKSLRGEFGLAANGIKSVRNALISLSTALATKAIADAGLRFERISLSMRAVSDSADEAANQLEFVNRIVDSLGLDLESTARAYTALTAASAGTSLEGAHVRDIFIGVTKAAAALGLSVDETEGALRAVQQMMSKGNVQAEELRGQLGERLPGAFNMAAEAMGVSTVELNKMLERGDVLASELLPRLADVLENRFGAGAERASTSVRASFNRLGTSFFRLKSEIARAGVNDALAELAVSLSDLFNNMVRDGKAEAFGNAVAAAIRGIGFVAVQTTELVTGLFSVLDSFFATIGNRIASITQWVDYDEIRRLSEREKMGAEARGQANEFPSIITGSAIVGSPNDPRKSELSELEKLLQSIERKIRLNTDLASSARDGASAQDALNAAFDAEQTVAELSLSTDSEKKDALDRLTDANIRLLQSERDVQKVEEQLQKERERSKETLSTIEELTVERDNLLRLNTARLESIRAYRLEKEEQTANVIIRKLGIDSISKEADTIRKLTREITRLSEGMTEPINAISEAFVSAVGNMENALTEFVTTGKMDFEDLANSILRDINRIFIQQLFTKPLTNAITGSGAAGIFSGIAGLFGNSMAAEGGVFTHPYIGGEAGPEAAVPLPDGRRIPVEMRGGGQVIINMNIKPPETRPMMNSERQMLREAGLAISRQVSRATA